MTKLFATELDVGPLAREGVRAVQWELFLFREVCDVLPGPRPGIVVVIHTGNARPGAWRSQLRRSAAEDAGPGGFAG